MQSNISYLPVKILSQLFFFLSSILTGVFLSSQAQGESFLSLENVLDSTEKHHPHILKAQWEVQEQERLTQVRQAPFDPKVTFEYGKHQGYPNAEYQELGLEGTLPGTGIKIKSSLDRTEGVFPPYQGERNTGNEGRWKGSITIPLLRGLITDQVRTDLENQKLRTQAQGELEKLTKIQTYTQAAMAYWNWRTQVENRRTLEDLLKIAYDTDSFIEQKVQRGDSPRIDKIENQKIIAQRQAQVVTAKQNESDAALKLSLFLRSEEGLPLVPKPQQASVWTQEPAPKNIQSELHTEAIVNAFPSIRQILVDIKSVENSQTLQAQNQLPQLDFKYEDSTYNGALPGNRTDAREQFAGLYFSFPFLNLEARNRKKSLEFKIQGKKAELQIKKDQLKNYLEQTLVDLHSLESVLIHNQTELKTSEALVFAERRRFRAGNSSLFLVNTRESEATLAKIKVHEALLKLKSKHVELQLFQNQWIKKY
jgi:outer membrane protein TolC